MNKRSLLKKQLRNKNKSRVESTRDTPEIFKNDDGTYGFYLDTDEQIMRYICHQIMTGQPIDLRSE